MFGAILGGYDFLLLTWLVICCSRCCGRSSPPPARRDSWANTHESVQADEICRNWYVVQLFLHFQGTIIYNYFNHFTKRWPYFGIWCIHSMSCLIQFLLHVTWLYHKLLFISPAIVQCCLDLPFAFIHSMLHFKRLQDPTFSLHPDSNENALFYSQCKSSFNE